MGAGEYVSVSSQADTEPADLARERQGLADNPDQEREELVSIYIEHGQAIGIRRRHPADGP
jgi:VIT1/CCC1 family predicted Fe2+/Mn2+ transporter